MSQVRILVVEPDLQYQRLLKTLLVNHSYGVMLATTARQAGEYTVSWYPDLLIIERDLPDQSGLELLRRIRSWSTLPVMMLSHRLSVMAKVEMFDLGADACFSKPFFERELLAQLDAVLRRVYHVGNAEAPLTLQHLTIDLYRHQVWHHGRLLRLTPTEYALLRTLVLARGQTVSHHALLRAVWGDYSTQHVAKLRVFIHQLRCKIELDPAQPQVLRTISGGYQLGVDAQAAVHR